MHVLRLRDLILLACAIPEAVVLNSLKRVRPTGFIIVCPKAILNIVVVDSRAQFRDLSGITFTKNDRGTVHEHAI